MPPERPVEGIVEAIVSYLATSHPGEPAVALLLDRLDHAGTPHAEPPVPPRHRNELASALARLRQDKDEGLADVGHAVHAAADSLVWRVDDGQYYAPGAPVGEGYEHGNMHTVLAEGEDFAMGLFLLVPAVDYRDHRHRAPEFYLNLTGPSAWRFDFGGWIELQAGSVVWNEPGRVHATRSGSASWLSVWAWLRDTEYPCEVVAEQTTMATDSSTQDGGWPAS